MNSQEANKIEYKEKDFNKDWKQNKKYYSVSSNQEHYGRKLMKEVEM